MCVHEKPHALKENTTSGNRAAGCRHEPATPESLRRWLTFMTQPSKHIKVVFCWVVTA